MTSCSTTTVPTGGGGVQGIVKLMSPRRFCPEARTDLLSFSKHMSAGYWPLEARVLGLVNDTHAAPAELGEDLVVADRLAYHDGVILPVCG